MSQSIRVLELFAGIGTFSLALRDSKTPYTIVDAVEVDPYAVKAFNAIHGTAFPVQDITTWNKYPQIDLDLITHGSPCFPAGTSVCTRRGYLPIEKVKVGDYALSHDNRFHKVLKTGGKEFEKLMVVKAQGSINTKCTKNHPFYVIRRETLQRHRGKEYKYSEPMWIEAKDLTKEDFVAVNIPQEEKNPLDLTAEDCWLLGRYVADGHIRHNKRKGRKNSYQYGVVYSIGNDKIAEFEKHLSVRHASIYPHTRSCYRAVVNSKEMVELIERLEFGTTATEKTIPQEILDLPQNLAEVFLDGYMSGDGYFSKITGRYSMTTVSKKLVLSFQKLVQKVYRVGANISYSKKSPTCVIEGRLCSQHDQYSVNFYKTRRPSSQWFIADEKVWYKVKKIENSAETAAVFNLEVEMAHTYTANNLVVHNCTDISLAGLQAGCDPGSNTRSSLMWQTVRIVRTLKPRYVVWENVKNLLSKKHRHNFDAYIQRMFELGYSSYYKVLNAKDFGVPQNRERVFTISIRDDMPHKDFVFPNPSDKRVALKDILEEKVDERYFYSEERLAGLLRTNYAQNKRICSPDGISGTLTTMQGGNTEPKVSVNGRVRKLTPRECWRLQGIPDSDFDKAKATGLSDSRLYKLAGNGICEPCLVAIFKELFDGLSS